MVALADVHLAIRGAFNAPLTGWEARQPTVPLTYAGDAFVPPRNANWARVVIMAAGPGQQVEFGIQKRVRRIGILRVQFLLVAGMGSGLAWQYADSVKSIVEARTIGGVRFQGTSFPVEDGVDGAWSRYRCDTYFDADELTTT